MTLRDVKAFIEQEEKKDPTILDLEIATTEDHEYWGNVINPASEISVGEDQIDGPKKPARMCIVIS